MAEARARYVYSVKFAVLRGFVVEEYNMSIRSLSSLKPRRLITDFVSERYSASNLSTYLIQFNISGDI